MVQPPRKHVVDRGPVAIASAATQTDTVIVGTINPIPYTTPTNVAAQSQIFGLTFILSVTPTPTATNAAIQKLDWYLGFNIGGAQTLPAPDNVGQSVIQNQIFHQDMTTFPMPAVSSNTNLPRTMAWHIQIKLPKAWTRFNLQDQLQFAIKSTSADSYTYAWKCIFTEHIA